jgi:hypothetical protein
LAYAIANAIELTAMLPGLKQPAQKKFLNPVFLVAILDQIVYHSLALFTRVLPLANCNLAWFSLRPVSPLVLRRLLWIV